MMVFLVFIGLGVLGNLMNTSSRSGTADHANPVASPAPTDPKITAMSDVKLLAFSWHTDSLGGMMFANFTVSNNSEYTIKDIEITCVHSGKSGTQIDTNKRTIYDIVNTHSKRRFPEFNMGFIHSQAVSSSCRITDLKAD